MGKADDRTITSLTTGSDAATGYAGELAETAIGPKLRKIKEQIGHLHANIEDVLLISPMTVNPDGVKRAGFCPKLGWGPENQVVKRRLDEHLRESPGVYRVSNVISQAKDDKPITIVESVVNKSPYAG